MNRERPFVLNEGDRNSFSGYVFVDGTYQYVYDDTYAGSNIAFTVDESENYKLPFRNPDDNTSGGIINNFNFGNFEQAEEMLKTKCSQSGKAKIAIEDMNAENSEGAAFTRLSKVFKLIPDNKNCSYPNANNQ